MNRSIHRSILYVILLLFAAGCSPLTIPETGATPPATSPPAPSSPSIQTTAAPASPASAPVTCKAPASVTPSLTEGPYYKQGSPETTALAGNLPGTKLSLSGYVLDANCKPVAHAWLDFWQADAQGQYDNSGYTLRGHQYTDTSGYYHLDTIVPGEYPGRTEHIHVKVQAPNGPVLTTQLFFPNVAGNQSDQIFNPNLIVTDQSSNANQVTATYNFIIPVQ